MHILAWDSRVHSTASLVTVASLPLVVEHAHVRVLISRPPTPLCMVPLQPVSTTLTTLVYMHTAIQCPRVYRRDRLAIPVVHRAAAPRYTPVHVDHRVCRPQQRPIIIMAASRAQVYVRVPVWVTNSDRPYDVALKASSTLAEIAATLHPDMSSDGVALPVRLPVASGGVAPGDTIECGGLPEITEVKSDLELAEALMPELPTSAP